MNNNKVNCQGASWTVYEPDKNCLSACDGHSRMMTAGIERRSLCLPAASETIYHLTQGSQVVCLFVFLWLYWTRKKSCFLFLLSEICITRCFHGSLANFLCVLPQFTPVCFGPWIISWTASHKHWSEVLKMSVSVGATHCFSPM